MRLMRGSMAVAAMYKKTTSVFTRAAGASSLLFTMLAGVLAAPPAAGQGLKFREGQHLDVLVDDKVAVRYMHAYDDASPERLNQTYKPYLHVFDAEGSRPITKGPGGEYPHHR